MGIPMTFVPPDFVSVMPEIFVLSMACAVLVIDVFLKDEQRGITFGLCQLTLLGALLLTLIGYGTDTTVTFNGHFIRDAMGDVLKVGIYVAIAMVLLFSRDYLIARGIHRGEYYVLALLGVLGMMVMVSAASFLTAYLGLELLSLSLYALVAFDRDNAQCSEAAMKYFVLGALASGMLLYGISMIYGTTGSLDLRVVAGAAIENRDGSLLPALGVAFLVVGLAFKLGAVPFHMWLPDVYQGAPTSVTLYVGSAPKLAAFALLMRILVEGLGGLESDWQQMLIVLSVLSIAVGNVIAIAQTNIKRMLAYSTISHVGFILLGIIAGTADGYSAAMFYALTYVLTTVGSFGIIILAGRSGCEVENIQDLRGLNDRSPWFAFLMLVMMMSTAGIPFLVGFYAKFAVLMAIVNVGMVGLAVYAVVLSVVGAFYYLRVVKVMYFDKSEDSTPILAALDTKIVIGANGLILILLGLYPTGLMGVCISALQ